MSTQKVTNVTQGLNRNENGKVLFSYNNLLSLNATATEFSLQVCTVQYLYVLNRNALIFSSV